jgi:ABC-type uncharacterized transport system substrate-binding protein
LFRDALPNLVRVGVLWNPNNPGKVAEFREVEAAASMIGIESRSRRALRWRSSRRSKD